MSEAMRAMEAEIHRITPEVIAKIKAEVNYDLIKNNNYDKFGDGQYISVETVTDILNETFGFVWSWEVINYFDKGDYVVCHGRLTVPGLGVRDGVGQAKADKKDNSTMFSSAASFAFKSAAKKIGIAKNIFNKEAIGFDVFEPGTVQLPAKGIISSGTVELEPGFVNNNGTQMPGQNVIPMSDYTPVEKPQVQTQKNTPSSTAERAKELKEAYGIKTKPQFVAFTQIWNPSIETFEQITPEVIDSLHMYVENNSVEFEDFQACDY